MKKSKSSKATPEPLGSKPQITKNKKLEVKQNWIALSGSTPGQSHLRRGMPCQDAAMSKGGNRPFVIVCDGSGSSARSDLGAQEGVACFEEQLDVLEPLLSQALDQPNRKEATKWWQRSAKLLYRALAARQASLAKTNGDLVREYAFTVTAAVLGKSSMGFLSVGDSALVLRRKDELILASEPQNGEFANQTVFVRHGKEPGENLVTKVFSVDDVEGVIAFSDGVSCKVLEHLSFRPHKELQNILEKSSEGIFRKTDLHDFLADPIWNGTPGDDRCLALLARSNMPIEDKPKVKPDAGNGGEEKAQELPQSSDKKDADFDNSQKTHGQCLLESNVKSRNSRSALHPPSRFRRYSTWQVLTLCGLTLILEKGIQQEWSFFSDENHADVGESPKSVVPPITTNAHKSPSASLESKSNSSDANGSNELALQHFKVETAIREETLKGEIKPENLAIRDPKDKNDPEEIAVPGEVEKIDNVDPLPIHENNESY
jgi:hypothetical protein